MPVEIEETAPRPHPRFGIELVHDLRYGRGGIELGLGSDGNAIVHIVRQALRRAFRDLLRMAGMARNDQESEIPDAPVRSINAVLKHLLISKEFVLDGRRPAPWLRAKTSEPRSPWRGCSATPPPRSKSGRPGH